MVIRHLIGPQSEAAFVVLHDEHAGLRLDQAFGESLSERARSRDVESHVDRGIGKHGSVGREVGTTRRDDLLPSQIPWCHGM